MATQLATGMALPLNRKCHPPQRFTGSIGAAVLLCLALVLPAIAQTRLYAGLLNTKGYVVGSALSESGLLRHEGDTTWSHVGWNHPRVNAMAVDPRDTDTFYLAAGNGVLRTRDGGASWRITTDWEVTESQDVAVDPNAPDEVYVATAYGVWASSDGGDTWAETNTGLGQTYVQSLAVDREQVRRLLAGTWGGLYETTDGAATWSTVLGPEFSILHVTQSPSNPHLWLAGTQNHGVLLSQDNGASWEEAEGTSGLSIYSVASDPFDPDRIAAGGWDAGILLSTDGGRTWTRRDETLPTPNFYRVVFDPVRRGTLWAASVEEGIFRSDDAGETWRYAGLDGTLVFHLTFVDEGNN